MGPWRSAGRRLRGDRAGVAFATLLATVTLAFLAAPLWAETVAHTGPTANHLSDTVDVGGGAVDVVALDGTPIGPTWRGRYLLGADANGRDVAVRVLYAGRTSLLISLGAALVCVLLATLLGLVAGYVGGWVDTAIVRGLDVVWSFPVLLFGVALGTVLALEEVRLGPLSPETTSKVLTALIIGVVSVPYVARPVRARVQALSHEPFVEAAVSEGAGRTRIMAHELLPNLSFTVVAFFTVLVGNAIVLEAALSFLGAGVRSPEASLGSMLRDGLAHVSTAPHLVVVPSAALTLVVLAVNLVGDAIRRALDPNATVARPAA
ncbi:MAG: peptide/nickel transport system permease protein [Solirubrobacteraceae bacterium]|jgi:peptide/nickel transport system permease protein|nr:peptide/nickel transport system permease protein [Solirubrobacteraceae bacterium]